MRRQCWSGVIPPSDPQMIRKKYLLHIVGLCLLLLLLSVVAAIPALHALNMVSFPVSGHWDRVLRNVGYSIIAGVALILLVAIYDALRAAIREHLQ